MKRILRNRSSIIPPARSDEFQRRFRFPRFHLLGITVLMLVLLLVLLGLFDTSYRETAQTAPGLEIYVKYPTRLRHKTKSFLEVSLKNTSMESQSGLTVAFALRYFSGFSNVQFLPSPERITQEGYQVRLDRLDPGDSRWISVDIQGERYGNHAGSIDVSGENGSRVRVPITTFVLP